jgi:hypothetical protein
MVKTPEKIVEEVLRPVVELRDERSLAEVIDDISALVLFCRRNGMRPEITWVIEQCRRLGSKIRALLLSTEGLEEMVGINLRAMVYGTVDEILLRVAVTSASWNLFTVLASGTSFILQRLAEYAYVQSAENRQEDFLRLACLELSDEMWEALAHNPATKGITWEKCLEHRELVRQVREALDSALSPEILVRFYTLLFYARLVEAMRAVSFRA